MKKKWTFRNNFPPLHSLLTSDVTNISTDAFFYQFKANEWGGIWHARNLKSNSTLCTAFRGEIIHTCHQNSCKLSRKLGNYNGTIIFENNIMQKSSPISSGFTFLPLLFWCSLLMLSVMLKCRQKQTKQPKQ